MPLLFSKLKPHFAESRKRKREHHLVSWVESPLHGADDEDAVFSQRHEANSLELFFDLFFVANLATFTAYHSITDHDKLFAYIGFFAILWATWFQYTLYDVRFARDSVFERGCKVVQMVVFVGLALVGTKFSPSSQAGTSYNISFRVLCYTLILSRLLLAIQYSVVLIWTFLEKGYNKLYLPLGLNVIVYIVAAIIFGAITPYFKDGVSHPSPIYATWWLVMFAETAATITISCWWRMLSFKKTHIVERMGLLSLIVIGEGAIGVTKTVGKVMGTYGLDPMNSGQIISIVLILMFYWMLYFDNQPHSHFGTIKQQIWFTLHFVFHLAVVGVVEGSQQMTLGRYTLSNTVKLDDYIQQACLVDHLDGEELVDTLLKNLKYFKFEDKIESLRYMGNITTHLYEAGNQTGICSPENLAELDLPEGYYPESLIELFADCTGALFAQLGMKTDISKHGAELALKAWQISYVYFWSAFVLSLFCLVIFLVICRKNKADIFDWVSISTRSIGVLVGAALLGLAYHGDGSFLYEFIYTGAILPTVVCILFIVLLLDWFARFASNRSLKRSGEAYDPDDFGHEHGGHGHEHEHEHNDSDDHIPLKSHPAHMHGHGYSDSTGSQLATPQLYGQFSPDPNQAAHLGTGYSAYSSPSQTPYMPPVNGMGYAPVPGAVHYQ